MIFKNLFVGLAATQLVACHGVITKAVGNIGGTGSALGVVSSTPRDGSRQDPFQLDTTVFSGDNADACGQTPGGGPNIPAEQITKVVSENNGLPKVSPGGMLLMTLHQVNGDGAGPYDCQIDSSGTGTGGWSKIDVVTNVPGRNSRSRTRATDFPLIVRIPENQKCSGSAAGKDNLCMVRCNNAAGGGPFGGCVPIKMVSEDGAAEGGENTEIKEESEDKGAKKPGADGENESPRGEENSGENEVAGTKEIPNGKEAGGEKGSAEGKETSEGKSNSGGDDADGQKESTGGKESADGKASPEGKESADEKKSPEGKESADGKKSPGGNESTEGKESSNGKEAPEEKGTAGKEGSGEGKKTTDGKLNSEGDDTGEVEESVGGKEISEGVETSKGKPNSDGSDPAEKKDSAGGKESSEGKVTSEGKSNSGEDDLAGQKESAGGKVTDGGKGLTGDTGAEPPKHTEEASNSTSNSSTIEQNRPLNTGGVLPPPSASVGNSNVNSSNIQPVPNSAQNDAADGNIITSILGNSKSNDTSLVRRARSFNS